MDIFIIVFGVTFIICTFIVIWYFKEVKRGNTAEDQQNLTEERNTELRIDLKKTHHFVEQLQRELQHRNDLVDKLNSQVGIANNQVERLREEYEGIIDKYIDQQDWLIKRNEKLKKEKREIKKELSKWVRQRDSKTGQFTKQD